MPGLTRNQFNLMTAAYPYPPDRSPCSDGYPNQCAIRMSIALEDGPDIRLTNYTEPKCSHGHARGARSLAYWLMNRFGRPLGINEDPGEVKKAIQNYLGIVFFRNCFERQDGSRGDHMDLWSASRGTRTFGDPQNRSDQVWFWRAL